MKHHVSSTTKVAIGSGINQFAALHTLHGGMHAEMHLAKEQRNKRVLTRDVTRAYRVLK